MGEAAGLLSFPAIVAVGLLLGRWWPGTMRSVARSHAVVTGVALLGIIATGWGHDWGPAATVHRRLSQALLIWDWNAVPFSIGVSLARPRGRPFVAVASALAPIATPGAIFLASITGYLGPSYGPIDPMTYTRFRVLHYGVFPWLALGLSGAWYWGQGPHRGASPREVSGPPTAA
jgi:hypothetical protein